MLKVQRNFEMRGNHNQCFDLSAKTEDFREASVEIRMKNLSLQNLVSYLYTLESTPYNLNIKEIQITSPKEKLSIEVTFIASRLERK